MAADGLPVISHYDTFYGNLRLTRCSDPACNIRTSTAVDSPGDVGKFNSIAIGGEGLPVISYFQDTTNHLKVVHCARVGCGVP